MQDSKIQWTDHTFNPWRGCTKVSEGCRNCYAETLSHRNPKVLGVWGPNGTRVLASDAMWKEPLKWDAIAKESGTRQLVFCASLADIMEDRPELHLWRERLFTLIQKCRNLDWLLLTKRPENYARFLPWSLAGSMVDQPGVVWPHVWLGTSVENQEAANKRIPPLLKTPAAVRFLSCEPLLEPVQLDRLWLADRSGWWNGMDGRLTVKCKADNGQEFWAETEKPLTGKVDWVIVGGESGPGARPFNPSWAKDIVRQCQDAGAACFVKQLGENVLNFTGVLRDKKGGDPSEWPEEIRVREFPNTKQEA